MNDHNKEVNGNHSRLFNSLKLEAIIQRWDAICSLYAEVGVRPPGPNKEPRLFYLLQPSLQERVCLFCENNLEIIWKPLYACFLVQMFDGRSVLFNICCFPQLQVEGTSVIWKLEPQWSFVSIGVCMPNCLITEFSFWKSPGCLIYVP